MVDLLIGVTLDEKLVDLSRWRQRQQPYKGGNKDNYVRAHFKKLEADGRCFRSPGFGGS